jgi:hypothetical protein
VVTKKYHKRGRFRCPIPPAPAERGMAMRITGVAVMMVAAAGSVWAGPGPAEARQLTLCMGSVAGNVAFHREVEARRVVSGIFARIGVKIQWHGPGKCPTEAIYVSYSNNVPAGMGAAALAYALPYEGTHIVVFLDRVKNMAPSAGDRLLGYTLAHEVTHILEGIVRHSESGIMKAYLDGDDHLKMRGGKLGFAAEDVYWIYRGLEERELRLAASASVARSE